MVVTLLVLLVVTLAIVFSKLQMCIELSKIMELVVVMNSVFKCGKVGSDIDVSGNVLEDDIGDDVAVSYDNNDTGDGNGDNGDGSDDNCNVVDGNCCDKHGDTIGFDGKCGSVVFSSVLIDGVVVTVLFSVVTALFGVVVNVTFDVVVVVTLFVVRLKRCCCNLRYNNGNLLESVVLTCVSFDVESDSICSGNDGIVVLVETFGNSIFDGGKVGEICDDSRNESG